LYAGDFHAGEREARDVIQLNPSYEKSHLTLAYAQLGQGQLAQASETYLQLAKISKFGASLAASGLADLALYEGRLSDAAKTIEEGAAADLTAKRPDAAAAKFAALAYVRLLQRQKAATFIALQKALQNGKGAKLRFLAARIYVAAGEVHRFTDVTEDLATVVLFAPAEESRRPG